MMKLYREHVLGEKTPEGGFVPLASIGGIAPAPAPKEEQEDKEVGSFGD